MGFKRPGVRISPLRPEKARSEALGLGPFALPCWFDVPIVCQLCDRRQVRSKSHLSASEH